MPPLVPVEAVRVNFAADLAVAVGGDLAYAGIRDRVSHRIFR